MREINLVSSDLGSAFTRPVADLEHEHNLPALTAGLTGWERVMGETKFTPGPWYLRTNRHPTTTGKLWGGLDAAPPGGVHQRPIPGVNVTWELGTTSYANARLIALAPAMFELLEQWVVGLTEHELDPQDLIDESERLLARIRGEQ